MSSAPTDDDETAVHVSIAGFHGSDGAEQMLETAREHDPRLFEAFGGARVAPVLGGLHLTYELLATVGVLSFPLGVLSSYVASVLQTFFHQASTHETRLQIVLVRGDIRVFLFVDRGATKDDVAVALKALFEQVRPDHDPR